MIDDQVPCQLLLVLSVYWTEKACSRSEAAYQLPEVRLICSCKKWRLEQQLQVGSALDWAYSNAHSPYRTYSNVLQDPLSVQAKEVKGDMLRISTPAPLKYLMVASISKMSRAIWYFCREGVLQGLHFLSPPYSPSWLSASCQVWKIRNSRVHTGL